MGETDTKRTIPIYFYYLAVSKQKDSKDTSVYDMNQVVSVFSV